jgi:hypothetical protein
MDDNSEVAINLFMKTDVCRSLGPKEGLVDVHVLFVPQ